MEIILAIVVGLAVIFFGALISMGNERQRKAIDALCEQVVLWAIQDLRIKRERLARDVRIDDPIGWLNRIATKFCGYKLNLQVVEAFDNPQALICSANGESKVIFSPLSPNEIHRMSYDKRNKLSQYSNRNPLMVSSQKMESFEISVLNNNISFDLELPIVWKRLTDQDLGQTERIWLYLVT